MGKEARGAQDVGGGGGAGAPAPLINASFDMIHSASGKSGKCLHYLGGESWSRWCFPLISPLRTRGRKVVRTINQRGNMTLIVRAMGRGLRQSPAVHYHPGGAGQPQGPYQCPVRMPFRSPRALLQPARSGRDPTTPRRSRRRRDAGTHATRKERVVVRPLLAIPEGELTTI